MNFKRFHESKNLWDGTYTKGFIGTTYIYKNTGTSANCAIIPCEPSTTYTVKKYDESNRFAIGTSNVLPYDEIQLTGVYYLDTATSYTFTTDSSAHYMVVYVSTGTEQAEPRLMVNAGSTALPYEPYSSEVWHDIPHYIHNTSTDTITTLPAVLYPNDTTATVGLKGNTVQSGTPTPDNPIMPQGCGDLETVGAKAGQYKIPISSAGQTTPIYLGEVETTRRIKKLVLTGEEEWATVGTADIYGTAVSQPPITSYAEQVCSHFISASNWAEIVNNDGRFGISSPQNQLVIHYNTSGSIPNFKSYLQQQYAAGTPVTIWYVLAEPTTGIFNEPLMKIGDYADEVSGITTPTIAGANTISVDTTLQPSEVTVNYKGWHPVQSVHERENGQWD